jgi:hypothetical protein
LDPDLAGGPVDVPAPEPDQLIPAHVGEGGDQHEAAISHGDGFGDLENDGKRNGLALAGFFLTRPYDPL